MSAKQQAEFGLEYILTAVKGIQQAIADDRIGTDDMHLDDVWQEIYVLVNEAVDQLDDILYHFVKER